MSAVHIPRVLSQRGKTQVEIDRENYEKTQSVGIQKAVNAQETPVKEKHARTAIIGTHQEHGSSMFWAVTTKLQLQGNPIVCWKFCQVLHKLMRDGHSQVIVDSQKYTSMITDLGKMWGHLKEGYGKLIAFYTKLLVQKLGFHKKNSAFPGNLMLREGMLDRICSNDINTYFELSVDMLDYMDDILALQATVFGSLDMSRSNSMTSSGQCRLAPLIMCIQDSCQLYDFLVNILFKLHSSLPPDTLGGHRTRFYQQYKSLKQFYYSSGNLQYFKNLIKVPLLPDDPPNFLRAADLSSHVKPVVVVPDPEPEIEEVPEPEPKLDMLVDTSAPTAFGENGAASPPVPDEKDLMISQLLHEVNELKRELSRLREEMIRMQEEDQAVQESLENRIKELEMELNELRQIAESTTQENEALKTALSEGDKNSEAAANIAAIEKVAKGNEEKFRKMKDIYAKLREEHVQLLRQQADVKKQLTEEARSKRQLEGKHSELYQEVVELKAEKSKVLTSLQQNATESAVQLAAAGALKDQHEHEKQDLENRIQELESERAEHGNNMEKCQTDLNVLRADLQKTISDKESLERQLGDLMQQSRIQLLAGAIKQGQHIIRDALDQADNPHHSTVTCAAEYLLNRSQPARDSLADLRRAYDNYHTDKNNVGDVIGKICDFSHHLGNVIVLGFATSHSVTIEPGEELSGKCQGVGDKAISLLGVLKEGKEGGREFFHDYLKRLWKID